MQDFQECRPTNALSLANKQAGYSSVGRASDCRHFAVIRWSLARFRVAGFALLGLRAGPAPQLLGSCARVRSAPARPCRACRL